MAEILRLFERPFFHTHYALFHFLNALWRAGLRYRSEYVFPCLKRGQKNPGG